MITILTVSYLIFCWFAFNDYLEYKKFNAEFTTLKNLNMYGKLACIWGVLHVLALILFLLVLCVAYLP